MEVGRLPVRRRPSLALSGQLSYGSPDREASWVALPRLSEPILPGAWMLKNLLVWSGAWLIATLGGLTLGFLGLAIDAVVSIHGLPTLLEAIGSVFLAIKICNYFAVSAAPVVVLLLLGSAWNDLRRMKAHLAGGSAQGARLQVNHLVADVAGTAVAWWLWA